jgi:hypothetical protein
MLCTKNVCDFYCYKAHFRKTCIECPWYDAHHPVFVVLNVVVEGLYFSFVLPRSPFSCRHGLSTYVFRGALENTWMLLLKWDEIDFSYIFSWFPFTVRETLVNNLLGWEMFCKQASIGGNAKRMQSEHWR